MIDSLHITGVGPVADLKVSFAPRINIITGDNGLGKSFLLDVIVWSLTGNWPGNRVAMPTSFSGKALPTIQSTVRGTQKPKHKQATYDRDTQAWKRERGRPLKPGLVVYAAVDGGFLVWDPNRNYWRSPAIISESALSLVEEDVPPRAYDFTPEDVTNGLTAMDGKRLCAGVIDDLVEWLYQSESGEQGVSTISPFGVMSEAIRELSHPEEQISLLPRPRRIFIDDSRRYPIFKLPYGNVPYSHLSAGAKRIIHLAYLMVWAWYEHVQAAELKGDSKPTENLILLVDEIECHLHPKWQRAILPAVLKVARGLSPSIQVQVFAVTHSPLVLASLEPYFEADKDRLFLFDLQDGEVQFGEYPWTPYGDASAWLQSPLFGLRQARSIEAEAAIAAANQFMRNDIKGLFESLNTREKIHAQLLLLLPGNDPFWPRWIVARETKKTK